MNSGGIFPIVFTILSTSKFFAILLTTVVSFHPSITGAVAIRFFTFSGYNAEYTVARVPPVQYPCNETLSTLD